MQRNATSRIGTKVLITIARREQRTYSDEPELGLQDLALVYRILAAVKHSCRRLEMLEIDIYYNYTLSVLFYHKLVVSISKLIVSVCPPRSKALLCV